MISKMVKINADPEMYCAWYATDVPGGKSHCFVWRKSPDTGELVLDGATCLSRDKPTGIPLTKNVLGERCAECNKGEVFLRVFGKAGVHL